MEEKMYQSFFPVKLGEVVCVWPGLSQDIPYYYGN